MRDNLVSRLRQPRGVKMRAQKQQNGVWTINVQNICIPKESERRLIRKHLEKALKNGGNSDTPVWCFLQFFDKLCQKNFVFEKKVDETFIISFNDGRQIKWNGWETGRLSANTAVFIIKEEGKTQELCFSTEGSDNLKFRLAGNPDSSGEPLPEVKARMIEVCAWIYAAGYETRHEEGQKKLAFEQKLVAEKEAFQ